MILAIDTGTELTAVVAWNGRAVTQASFLENRAVIEYLNTTEPSADGASLYIESVQSFGMAVGQEVFATCIWIGRFAQTWDQWHIEPAHLVYRRDVKLHHCQSAKATDANIRQALIDRFGPPGTKKNPGPVTYGLKSHLWSAFAIAVYAWDKEHASVPNPLG